jgi:hypothetical protein
MLTVSRGELSSNVLADQTVWFVMHQQAYVVVILVDASKPFRDDYTNLSN